MHTTTKIIYYYEHSSDIVRKFIDESLDKLEKEVIMKAAEEMDYHGKKL